MSKKLKIGLFGFGCVGQGLYHVLNNSTGFKAEITKVCLKNTHKIRTISNDLITYDKWDILNNSEINVIVELIDDANEAFIIVSESLKRGKNVVTANKKMLAEHFEELFYLQQKNNVSLLYEASACGSIPVIRSLEEYFDNEDLNSVSGIFNGTTNYILSKIVSEKISYKDALKQAQELGFAESNPTNDVDGFDAKYKAVIVALHAFGIIIKPEQIFNIGISTLNDEDIVYAFEKRFKIKLTPIVKRLNDNKITVFVLPRFIKENDYLFNVDDEYNGVVIGGEFSGEQFFKGKGAGSLPTGSAVLSDVSALSYGYKYEYKKYFQNNVPVFTNDVYIEIYFRYHASINIDVIKFDEINEKYIGRNYNYIIGKIKLENLIINREFILSNNIFISLVNENVYSIDAKKEEFVNLDELVTA